MKGEYDVVFEGEDADYTTFRLVSDADILNDDDLLQVLTQQDGDDDDEGEDESEDKYEGNGDNGLEEERGQEWATTAHLDRTGYAPSAKQ